MSFSINGSKHIAGYLKDGITVTQSLIEGNSYDRLPTRYKMAVTRSTKPYARFTTIFALFSVGLSLALFWAYMNWITDIHPVSFLPILIFVNVILLGVRIARYNYYVSQYMDLYMEEIQIKNDEEQINRGKVDLAQFEMMKMELEKKYELMLKELEYRYNNNNMRIIEQNTIEVDTNDISNDYDNEEIDKIELTDKDRTDELIGLVKESIDKIGINQWMTVREIRQAKKKLRTEYTSEEVANLLEYLVQIGKMQKDSDGVTLKFRVTPKPL